MNPGLTDQDKLEVYREVLRETHLKTPEGQQALKRNRDAAKRARKARRRNRT